MYIYIFHSMKKNVPKKTSDYLPMTPNVLSPFSTEKKKNKQIPLAPQLLLLVATTAEAPNGHLQLRRERHDLQMIGFRCWGIHLVPPRRDASRCLNSRGPTRVHEDRHDTYLSPTIDKVDFSGKISTTGMKHDVCRGKMLIFHFLWFLNKSHRKSLCNQVTWKKIDHLIIPCGQIRMSQFGQNSLKKIKRNGNKLNS